VYESNDINQGWNGIIRQTDEKAAEGVYYYLIDYCDGSNASHEMHGFVQLIRSNQK
jgi:hypothetical protein